MESKYLIPLIHRGELKKNNYQLIHPKHYFIQCKAVQMFNAVPFKLHSKNQTEDQLLQVPWNMYALTVIDTKVRITIKPKGGTLAW